MMRMLAAAVGCLAAVGSAAAADSFDVGKWEYQNNCVVCHGTSGKGDGPFKGMVDTPAGADLTTLAKRNNGVFPFARVYETIDGTKTVKAHGTREMPIWGADYALRAQALKEQYGSGQYDPDVFVRARILALTEYVYRLQAK